MGCGEKTSRLLDVKLLWKTPWKFKHQSSTIEIQPKFEIYNLHHCNPDSLSHQKISRNIPILTNQTHPTNRNKTWDLWTKGCEQFRYSKFPAVQKPVGFTSFAGNLGAQVAWMECLESSLAVSPCHPGQHGHTHGKGKWSEKKTDFLITKKKIATKHSSSHGSQDSAHFDNDSWYNSKF